MTFRKAVSKTPLLEQAYRPGLQALRAEDRPHIEAEDTRSLTGSVDIDSAYARSDPSGNRWDFGIGYQHANRPNEVVYWVELHTASDSEVNVVIRKALWLQAWLRGPGVLLAEFERDIVWVSSGATHLTPTAMQKKQMAQAGLRQMGSTLRIPNQRKG